MGREEIFTTSFLILTGQTHSWCVNGEGQAAHLPIGSVCILWVNSDTYRSQTIIKEWAGLNMALIVCFQRWTIDPAVINRSSRNKSNLSRPPEGLLFRKLPLCGLWHCDSTNSYSFPLHVFKVFAIISNSVQSCTPPHHEANTHFSTTQRPFP